VEDLIASAGNIIEESPHRETVKQKGRHVGYRAYE
jgi:hypothetical protein